MKDFADNNFKFDENNEKFPKTVENTEKQKKLFITSNFYFPHSVFKRHVQQTCKNKGLFGKELKIAKSFEPTLYANALSPFPHSTVQMCKPLDDYTEIFEKRKHKKVSCM